MKVRLAPARGWAGRFRVGFVFEDTDVISGLGKAEAAGLLSVAAEENFRGQFKRVTVLRTGKSRQRLVLAGLGKRKEFGVDRVRVASARALKAAEEMGAEELGLLLPGTGFAPGTPAAFLSAAVEGALLGGYRYVEHRRVKDDESRPPAWLTLLAPSRPTPALEKVAVEAGAVAEATCYVRDLVNEPPSQKAPEMMAELAAWLAKPGRITVEVLRRDELVRRGMNGILRVGAGSHEPPCLVHMVYSPVRKAKRRVVVVGKGVTFDSGGLNLKPGPSMDGMKQDMAGAAAVFGLFKLLGEVDVAVEVHGLTPLVENLPSGTAQKPGDVIRHYGGKTSEVLNTDAEGRLILADALAYGSTLKPDLMLDIATLTGAAVVAVGDEYTALLGTAPAAIDRIIALGRDQGEFFWQLPLAERYRAHIASKVADIKNIGKPMNAGTIVAGLFLKEFVAGGTPWVHMDIAGPAFTREGWDYAPAGATGVPLRTLFAYLRSL
ncbi:MAG: leucyl aminopeptidase [bacterium]